MERGFLLGVFLHRILSKNVLTFLELTFLMYQNSSFSLKLRLLFRCTSAQKSDLEFSWI